MDRCVLDTSVIIKSIFKPFKKSLPGELYKKEMMTHEKCRAVIKKIEEKEIDTYIPRVCIVETAAVVNRLANKSFSMKISKRVLDSYEVVDEALLFDYAWTIAIDTGCSGFDSYFIALAKIKNATLLTDDKRKHDQAEKIDVDSILIRETDLGRIENF